MILKKGGTAVVLAAYYCIMTLFVSYVFIIPCLVGDKGLSFLLA